VTSEASLSFTLLAVVRYADGAVETMGHPVSMAAE
jgi:hypothetical protein